MAESIAETMAKTKIDLESPRQQDGNELRRVIQAARLIADQNAKSIQVLEELRKRDNLAHTATYDEIGKAIGQMQERFLAMYEHLDKRLAILEKKHKEN